MRDDNAGSFYEEDEPVGEIIQIFEQGVKGLTGPPTTGSVTLYLPIGGIQIEQERATWGGELICR